MSAPVKVGDILAGKYQVERILGVGGMGVVVSAKHLTLGEHVAIKFLLPQALARNDVVVRFLREGQATARLRGEHVARVHDVGKLETGAPFLVMEYLDGRDLGAVLREKGPFPVETAVDYLLQACEALSEAHSAGIVHRDLKPSNLFLIQRLDGTPSIKLIDFGISKIQLPSAEGADGEMTGTAVMMGSPLYMAPEQMASARDVDLRSDIWSLGILLHTMLTGTPPFRAPSVMQVYELIVAGAPPIRTLVPSVPEGIEAAILKCLHKDRRLRYSNVGELADAIAPFGPMHSRFTAERINRIILTRTGTNSVPPSSQDVQVPVVAITPAPASGTQRAEPTVMLPEGDEAPAESRKAPDATPLSNASGDASLPGELTGASDPHRTDGPWDQKTHPPIRRTRPAALIAAAAVLVVAAPVAYLVLRANNSQSVASGSVTASVKPPEATPPPAPEAPAPSVVPGMLAVTSSVEPTPAPPRATAEPTQSVKPSSPHGSGKASSSPKHAATSAPPPRPQPQPRGPDPSVLFPDPK